MKGEKIILLKKKCSKKLKRGSEAIENILIIGIIIALLVTIFYPQISNLITNVMDGLQIWVQNKTNTLFG